MDIDFSESVSDLLNILNGQTIQQKQNSILPTVAQPTLVSVDNQYVPPSNDKNNTNNGNNYKFKKIPFPCMEENKFINDITTDNNLKGIPESSESITTQGTTLTPKDNRTTEFQDSNKENRKLQSEEEFDSLIQFCNAYGGMKRNGETNSTEGQKKQQITPLSSTSRSKEPSKTKLISQQSQQQVQLTSEMILKNTNSIRYLHFKPWSGVSNPSPADNGYYYKFFNGGYVKIVKGLMEENGFKETNNKDWTVMWSCSGIPPNFFQSLMAYQKVNHFPKSYELTRKDLMNRNVSKMAISHGVQHFNFVPKTYLIPSEMSLFLEDAEKNKGQWYIAKPSANSQGKGIFVTDSVNEVLKKQNGSMVVSHYISNPMLINDLKFDLRIYVVLTSIHPLKIFLYDDGLVRFATSPYNTDNSVKPSRFVHLTNYAVNKQASNFIHNKDAQDDASGSKWSLSAFKDYLTLMGFNTQVIFERIEDLLIKTVLSIENVTFSAFEMNVPYRNNCFELLGFDILIDSNLKPWLLEVNLSPSMNTDSPLDLKIKGNLVADILTLVGIVPNDQRYLADSSHAMCQTVSLTERQQSAQVAALGNWAKAKNELSKIERYIIKEAEEELKRARRFRRIYPNENVLKYKNFFDIERPYNILLRNHEMDKHRLPGVFGRTQRTNSFQGQGNTQTSGIQQNKQSQQQQQQPPNIPRQKGFQ